SCGVWPSTAPTQLSRDIGVTGTQQDSSCGVWPSTAPPSFLGTSGRDSSKHRWSVRTAGTVQNTGGRCTQRGQFKTRWTVHTVGTVQNTGGRCTHRGQFRTRVVGAHSGDSS
ncbi:unnamed protein product, partial [Staurois parvus]